LNSGGPKEAITTNGAAELKVNVTPVYDVGAEVYLLYVTCR